MPPGSATAASASRSRMPSLPRTRFSSLVNSFSTFFSARVLIFCTSWMNSSTNESAISVSRTWHSVDSSVYRTGGAAARRSEGYSFAARARHTATSFSDTSPNSSGANSNPRTRWSLFTSASRLSSPSAPGSAFNSVKNVPPPPVLSPLLSSPSPPSSEIRSSSRDRVAADSRPTVVAQNRSSKVLTAEPTSRATRAGAGGSILSLRQRATTASASRSRDSSTPHNSTASHSASWAWSSTVHSRNLNASRISLR